MDDSSPDRSKRSVTERIDIRVGVERRRRWGREEKLRIVRESLAPNAVVTDVARRHEISTGLLYTWRKQALAGLLEHRHLASGADVIDARIGARVRQEHETVLDGHRYAVSHKESAGGK